MDNYEKALREMQKILLEKTVKLAVHNALVSVLTEVRGMKDASKILAYLESETLISSENVLAITNKLKKYNELNFS